MKILSGVSVVLMILLVHSLGDEKLIETTCKNTPNYHLCITTLRGSPGSATADLTGLSLITVEAVKKKTQQALGTVPSKSGAGSRCRDVYNAVLKADVPVAVEALTKGNPKFAEGGMADAAVEADLCQAAFKGSLPDPLNALNKALRDLAVLARAIIRNLL